MSNLSWVDEIEQRAEAATPGRLTAKCSPLIESWTAWHVMTEDGRTVANALTEGDAEFFEVARRDVLCLCRAVRELYKALSRAVERLDAYRDTEGLDGLRVLERWKRGGA